MRLCFISVALFFIFTNDAIASSKNRVVETPYQWQEYCLHEGEEDPSCVNSKSKNVVMFSNPELIKTLEEINIKYNKIPYLTDIEKYGVQDKWTAKLGFNLDLNEQRRGDCDDYVLSKRKELLKRGFPNSALYVTLVKVDELQEEMHMILIVKLGNKKYILDNINKNIVESKYTSYIPLFHLNPLDGKWYNINSLL